MIDTLSSLLSLYASPAAVPAAAPAAQPPSPPQSTTGAPDALRSTGGVDSASFSPEARELLHAEHVAAGQEET